MHVCCQVVDLQLPVTLLPTIRSDVDSDKESAAKGIGFRTGQTDNEAQFGEFPWMVAILKENVINGENFYVYQCGGTLIHRKAVLNAAHCVNRSVILNIFAITNNIFINVDNHS